MAPKEVRQARRGYPVREEEILPSTRHPWFVTTAEVRRIRELSEKGLSIRKIAGETGRNRTTVFKILKKARTP